MKKSRFVLAAAAAATLGANVAFGVDYTWLSLAAGTYSWNDATAWSPAGVPTLDGDAALFSGPISGPVAGGTMNVAVPGTFAVSTLTVGATNGAEFVTHIGAGGGGTVILSNGTGAGTARINHTGVNGAQTIFSGTMQLGSAVSAGTGSLNSTIRVEGDNSANISFGDLVVFADIDSADGLATARRTFQLNAGSQTATGSTYSFGNIQLSQPGALARGELDITAAGINAPTLTTAHGGTVLLNGNISDGAIAGGQLRLGFNLNATSHPPIPTTFIISGNNTYTGQTNLSKGIYRLNSNSPFGTGQLSAQYAANTYAANLQAHGEARTIGNNILLQNNLSARGDLSLTLNGAIYQSNNREVTNLISSGGVLTINGWIAPSLGSDGATETARAMTFDGPGKTVINGPVYNHRKPWLASAVNDVASDRAVDPDFGSYGGITKRGTGILTINSTTLPTITDGTTSFTGPTSTILGPTTVTGGLMQYLNPAAYGRIDSYTGGSIVINNNLGTSRINVQFGAAIGVLEGTVTDEFIGKLNSTTVTIGNDGGLALAPADVAKNLDFATGSLGANGVTRMSVGAVEAGVSYTGTITPNAMLGYRLGGGGTLTLPNANQLTGAQNVTVTNGGAVNVTAAQNYTGITTVRGDYIQTNEAFATANAATNNITGLPYAIRVNTMLVTNNLANGGVASGVGAASADASNLVLNGGTLKYTGAAVSSDRLFTIGPVGATLDSSGAGALNLTNTAATTVQDVGPISTATLTLNSRMITGLSDIHSLTQGMTVTAETAAGGTFLPVGTTMQGIAPANRNLQILVSSGVVAAGTSATLSFGNQDRNLTLTGNNLGANALASLLTDSAAGQLGIVKNGSGNWTLTNNNTFTGGVTVNQGQLTLNNVRGNNTTINGGALKIASGAPGASANTSAFAEGSFTIAGGATPAGKLDLNKSGAVFEYSTTSNEAAIGALIDSGYGTGNWAGNGITSSAAAADSNGHAVGYGDAAELGITDSFLGQPIDATTTLVRYTRQGDANLDGGTDIGDFSLLASNFNNPSSKWTKGDFNYDGITDIGDFAVLAANFNQAATGDLPRGTVPEPTTLGLLAAGLILGVRRRRN